MFKITFFKYSNTSCKLDTKKINEIVDLMKASDLLEFEIEQEGLKLRIRRAHHQEGIVSNAAHIHTQLAPAIVSSSTHIPFPVAGNSANAEKDYEYIKSPMVGTFYRSPSPESKLYVVDGSKVSKETVVCIIEAMKVMNEIQAETEGTILEVLVQNGATVEYGQNLFKIKKG